MTGRSVSPLGPRRVLHRRATSGFTLIEMMIVMLLLGLITSLTLPAMQRWHDGVQLRAKVTSVVQALRAAGFAAAATRRDLRMDRSSFSLLLPAGPSQQRGQTSDVVALPLPSGWSVQGVKPAHFLANGLCLAGSVDFLADGGERISVEVLGPICSVQTVAGSAGPRLQ